MNNIQGFMNEVEMFIEQGKNMTTIQDLPNYITPTDYILGETILISIIVLIVIIVGLVLKKIKKNKMKKEEK